LEDTAISQDKDNDKGGKGHPPPVNEQIQAPEVLLIDETGNKLGQVKTQDAILRAKSVQLDLVMVGFDQSPPVCRIMDFTKEKYKLKRKMKESRKKTHTVQLKEVQLRPRIEENDYQVKLKRALGFLEEGHKLQVVLVMQGREAAFRDKAIDVIKRFVAACSEFGKVEQDVKVENPKRLSAVLAARPKKPDKKPRLATEGEPTAAPKLGSFGEQLRATVQDVPTAAGAVVEAPVVTETVAAQPVTPTPEPTV